MSERDCLAQHLTHVPFIGVDGERVGRQRVYSVLAATPENDPLYLSRARGRIHTNLMSPRRRRRRGSNPEERNDHKGTPRTSLRHGCQWETHHTLSACRCVELRTAATGGATLAASQEL